MPEPTGLPNDDEPTNADWRRPDAPPSKTDREALVDHMRRCRDAHRDLVISELWLAPRGGEAIYVQLISRPVREAGGRLFRTAIIDQTARHRAERRAEPFWPFERVPHGAAPLAVAHRLRNGSRDEASQFSAAPPPVSVFHRRLQHHAQDD